MKSIPITHRKSIVAYALVDDDDFETLETFRWGRTPQGYAVRFEVADGARRHILMHRHILGLDVESGMHTDHRNHDRLDNRRENLRAVTVAQNNQNLPSRGGSSRYRGVSYCKATGRWRADARLDGLTRNLGRYASEEAAAQAASVWRAKNMPFAIESRGGLL